MAPPAPRPGPERDAVRRARRVTHRTGAAALLLSGSLWAAGCGDDSGAGDEASGSATTVATPGAELYEEACASCHGIDLRGTAAGPSHLSVVYEPDHHPDASFRMAIQSGVRGHHFDFGDMPPVEGLSDDEIDAIIEHVRTQQEEFGFEPYPPGS